MDHLDLDPPDDQEAGIECGGAAAGNALQGNEARPGPVGTHLHTCTTFTLYPLFHPSGITGIIEPKAGFP